MESVLFASLFLMLVGWCWLVWAVLDGGKTLNDWLVVVYITLCWGVYPLLVVLMWVSESVQMSILLLALLGVSALIFLFVLLVRRRPAGKWMPLAVVSQLSQAFSLISGPLLLLWLVVAVATDQSLWPGRWLMLPFISALILVSWTYLRNQQLTAHSLGEGESLLRIAHLSDIHISPTMQLADLKAIVEQVNHNAPDIVCITGDFVMPFSEDHHPELIEGLAGIEAPVYCCMGNHDLPIQQQLETELNGLGIHLLIDEFEPVLIRGRSILIGGLQFYWKQARERSLAALQQCAELSCDLRLGLVHDPRYFRWLDHDHFDVILSGHTHGGQVGLNFMGIPCSIFRFLGIYDQGWFHKPGCSMYVHRGNWHTGLPPRLGISSEIAVIDLHFDATSEVNNRPVLEHS